MLEITELRERASRCREMAKEYCPFVGAPLWAKARELERHAASLERRGIERRACWHPDDRRPLRTTHAPLAAGSTAAVYERRGHRRIDVDFAVAVGAGPLSQISRIVQLSRMGGRLRVSPMLPLGKEVVLRRGGVTLTGRIAWQKGNIVGIGFTEPLEERTYSELRRYP
jgi:hypothetical protein